MQIAPGTKNLFSMPSVIINSIWGQVRHARRRGRVNFTALCCSVSSLCFFLYFFWPKIESRPNCVNFTSHFSNCFASRLRPVPLLPQTCMFVGTFSARNPEGVVLLLSRQAQLVHVDDIIVCLTIYTNYPPLPQVHQPARQTPKESRSQPPSLRGSLTCSKWILLL